MSFNLNDWAIQNRLKPKTIKILESEDLDMVDDLKLLSVDDIGLLNMTLGQKNALKEAVKSLTIGSFDLSRKISREDEEDLLFYQSNTTKSGKTGSLSEAESPIQRTEKQFDGEKEDVESPDDSIPVVVSDEHDICEFQKSVLLRNNAEGGNETNDIIEIQSNNESTEKVHHTPGYKNVISLLDKHKGVLSMETNTDKSIFYVKCKLCTKRGLAPISAHIETGTHQINSGSSKQLYTDLVQKVNDKFPDVFLFLETKKQLSN